MGLSEEEEETPSGMLSSIQLTGSKSQRQNTRGTDTMLRNPVPVPRGFPCRLQAETGLFQIGPLKVPVARLGFTVVLDSWAVIRTAY